jgi:hypothetical protein
MIAAISTGITLDRVREIFEGLAGGDSAGRAYQERPALSETIETRNDKLK